MCGVCFLKKQEASVVARGPRQRSTQTTHHMVSGKIDPIAYKPIGKKSKEWPPPSIHTGNSILDQRALCLDRPRTLPISSSVRL